MMVPAPKRLDSVEVHNCYQEPVTVTVVFDNHKDKVEKEETVDIAAGGKFHFKEKILDMGTFTAVAPVKRVTVSHGSGAHILEPSVNGVVNKLDLKVNESGQLTQ